MGFNGGQALVAILILTVGGLALRQFSKSKRRNLESSSRTEDGSGEENEALRRDSESISDDASEEENQALRGESESTSRTNDGLGEEYRGSVEENEALRRDSESTSRTEDGSGEEHEALRRETESSSRTDSVSGEEYERFIEENEELRRNLELTSRTEDGFGEENEASRRDAESTSRTDRTSGEEYEGFVEENEALRRDSESTSRTEDGSGEENRALRGDSESTSRTDNPSGEENEVLRRDWESTLRTDDVLGEEYDVFLSFRGSDTRLNFTDCLYRSMVRAGIRVFLDSEELEVGENISAVLKAVNESRIYIPIFSRNFASSIWCLREVERMVERHPKSNGKKEIIPIFYDVKTDDVKLRTDLYKNAIIELKERSNPDEVERWQNALKTVGKIIGRELQGKRQGEEIDSIVEQVSRKLNKRHMNVPEHLVEDRAQVEAIMKLLDVGSDGVRFVGIHGMGGVGKTTLAKVMFNKLFYHFEGCCFLEDVRASSQPHNGLLNLQKKLLSGFVSSMITDPIENVDGGTMMIKRVFGNKKVLIVLDDLDEKEQLENLAGNSYWFCSGSRIIITTREESILKTQVDQSKGILAYEVLGMRFDLALGLFYKHAFRNDPVEEEYAVPSSKIVRTVGMLPLAVVVIGSHLFDMGNGMGHSDKRKVWDETLKKLKEGPFDKVRKTLMISYGRLEIKEKEVFLDIACFFTNEDKTYPFIMWEDCNYYPRTTMGVLSHRSLVKIRDDNRFWMHDQVRDFGRYIVLEEYPRKFCRMWIREKALNLLERKERNEDVEALSLMFNGHNFTREDLACLPKLRFLRVKESDFSGNFENLLLELRWLSWQTRGTAFRANNFHFSKLVMLDLSDSDIEDDWGGWSQMKMDKLKVLDLTGCMCLTRTPNFSMFTSLETLILARCVKLTTIDGSIGELKLLKTFNINGCRVLQELPAEFGSLQSLTEIIMPQNYRRFKLPETFGNLQSLLSFILDEHPGINELPNSIGRLVKLKRLSLCACVGIKELPCSIGDMEMLAELDLSKSGIVELPDSIGSLKKLKVIKVSYTMITKFPHSIGCMEMLEELHAKKCWKLTDENLEEIGKLSNLRILDISYTGVSRFPTVLGCLSRLETLEMSSSDRQEVPDLPSSLTHLHMLAPRFLSIPDLSSLVNLDFLELSILTVSMKEPNIGWTKDSLPSSLSTLKFRGINLLPPFSNLRNLSEMSIVEYPMSCFSGSQDLTYLRILKLRKCNLLEEIPGLALLKNLWCLDLNRLESLVEINGLMELESLEHFRIAHCDKIERLPNLSKLDKLRHIELEACPNITEIEGVKGLESFKLDKRGCTILERLLDDPGPSTWLSYRIPTYDVFLSFRGLDTRYGIVEILYKNLVRNKILVYRDDEAVSHGSGISSDLLIALDDSHIYIPFLSKNYASSEWCLHELARMVEHKKSNGVRKILPIFYNVEKDDVKLETDLYRKALNDHRRIYGDEVEDKVKEWESALRYVGDMDGYNLKTNSLDEVIDLVTKAVSSELVDADVVRRTDED